MPGGFCKPGESVLATAKRELYEETSVKDAYLQPFDIFSDVDRDPRGWIISHGFLALMNGENYKVHGGSDAWEARWFSVSIEKQELCKKVSENNAHIENLYTMKLICEEQDSLALEAIIKEYKIFENYHENIRYEIVKADGFAFDHAKIILCAYLNLQKEAADIGKIVFDLMPENFTLTELQKAYEIVNGKPLLVANFRRKIADYVVETKDMVMGAGHRPAKLFKRNVEAFYR